MSANREVTLPFERGETYSNQGVVTMTATLGEQLEGRCFEVDDTLHGTPHKVILRCVRNSSGAVITCARKFYGFLTTTGGFNRKIVDVCGAGEVGKPMDDAYVDVGLTEIPINDLFWVIEEGPCSVLSEVSSVALAAHAAIASDASGLVNGAAAAAGEAVLGTSDIAATITNTAVLVYVHSDRHESEAAG